MSDFLTKMLNSSSANWNHSAHCVTVSSRSHLFPRRSDKCKFWSESGI